MNAKLRKGIWYAALLVVVVALVSLLLTMTGPMRLDYKRPAGRGTEGGIVSDNYVVSPLRDSVTLGSLNVDLPLELSSLQPGVAVTLTRSPKGASLGKGTWSLAAAETSPAVLLNGAPVSGTPALKTGDVLDLGGAKVTFNSGRRGISGAIDWWESSKISHLYASPKILSGALPIVLKAFPVSVVLVLIAFAVAIPFGLALAFMKMARAPLFRWPATTYVDIIRGTPIFLQILLVFFGLPLMPFWQDFVNAVPAVNQAGLFGISNSMWGRAAFVLSFNSAAYMAEIFRAGIQSINKGQMEAAHSLGMTTAKAMTYVIIPQTVRRILPTMMSEFILLFKDTALFAAVGMPEMIMRSREVSSTTLNVSPYLLAAGFYLVVTIPLGRLVQNLENRLARSEGGGAATFEKSTEDNLAAAAAKKAAAEAAAAAAASAGEPKIEGRPQR